MIRRHFTLYVAAVATALFVLGTPLALAQGKIVCWKDASGKVVGCGDKVPAEFAGNATRELDKQGNVRKTGESAEEAVKRRAQEKELADAQAKEKRRLMEQKRQDDALLNTFTNEKEIDLKRDRELQALGNLMTQQDAALKGVQKRLAEAKIRAEPYEKGNKPAPATVKEDLARAESEKERVEREIAATEKAKTDTTVKYAEFRKRFTELKTGVPAPEVPAKAAVTAVPASAAPVSAKK